MGMLGVGLAPLFGQIHPVVGLRTPQMTSFRAVCALRGHVVSQNMHERLAFANVVIVWSHHTWWYALKAPLATRWGTTCCSATITSKYALWELGTPGGATNTHLMNGDLASLRDVLGPSEWVCWVWV